MVNVYIIVTAILVLIFTGWAYARDRHRRNVEKHGPLILFHTQRGINFIERVSGASPLFWKVFATVGIFVGFFFMINAALGLYQNAKFILMTPTAPAGATLVLPGLEIMGIRIPIIGWLVGIIVLLISHEFAHGIIARAEKIRVESVGAVFLGFLPIGAFVKPDEKKLQKEKTIKQLRIFVAGSFTNILVSVLATAIIVFLLVPAVTSPISGVKITKIEKNGSAYEAGLQEGMQITAFDGNEIRSWDQFNEMWMKKNYSAGQTVLFTTTKNNFAVTLKDWGNGRGRIGVTFCGKGIEKIPARIGTEKFSVEIKHAQLLFPPLMIGRNVAGFCENSQTLGDQTFWLFYEILLWVAIINFGVGIVNLLPIKPLDGGLMVESVVKRLVRIPNVANKLVIGVSLFFFLLLLINIFVPHIRTLIRLLGF